jgi:DNA-binding HxlR family transcriptional regulator
MPHESSRGNKGNRDGMYQIDKNYQHKIGKEKRKNGVEHTRFLDRKYCNTASKGIFFISGREDEGKEEKEIRAKTIEIIGEALGSISNGSRANIARYIRDKKDVKFEEIRRNFNLSSNTLTFHLNKLQSAHIVSQEKDRGSYSMGKLGEVVLDYLEALEIELSSKIKEMLS